MPLFHCFGCVLGVESCLTHGSTMVFVDLYNPGRVLKVLQDERCTAVHGVPTMFIGYLEYPEFKSFDLSHLRTGIMAGSPCPINYMRRVVDEMHMRDIVITYGQTESLARHDDEPQDRPARTARDHGRPPAAALRGQNRRSRNRQ